MSGNSIGKSFVVTTFGESHGVAMGCVIDGCPPGIKIDEEVIQKTLIGENPVPMNMQLKDRKTTQLKFCQEFLRARLQELQ